MKYSATIVLCLMAMQSTLGSSADKNILKMNTEDQSENFASCDQCKMMLKGAQSLSNMMSWQFDPDLLFSRLCVTVLPMFGHKSTTTICPDLKDQYLSEIKTIVGQDILYDGCEIFRFCPAAEFKKQDWSVPSTTMSPDQNLWRLDEEIIALQQAKLTQRSDPITFVQISDIHIDISYAKNTATECGYSICCRDNITGNGSAGKFGHYNCDASETLVTTILDFIQKLSPSPDFFVYLGDNSPHILDDTLESKLRDNLMVNTLLVDKLRKIGPIYPVLGNHEIYPTSLYNRQLRNTQVLLQSLSEQWPRMFKVTPDQIDNIRKHAYYTTLVMPGLRILTTNSQYDFLYNIYAFKSDLDPIKEEQRQFVRQTLQDARLNNEKVIYISHMKPCYSQTYPSYIDEINEIATNFSDVIILQLYGHEHFDLFLLNRDPANQTRVTGVSLAAPSITTYASSNIGVNPSFRVYTLDRTTKQPIDYVQYYIDIPKANEQGVAEVKKMYTFTQEYGVSDMTPSSFENISDRIHSNWTDFQKFEANFYVLASDRPTCSEEDAKCRRQLTCQTREASPLRFAACLFGY